MIVGLTYDLKPEPAPQETEPEDAYAEFDAPATVEVIAEAIRAGGHEVVRLGNFPQVLAALDTLHVDLVFNIAEGTGGRNRESQIPLVLEARGVPCVGADALSLGISLDKVVAKQVFLAEGIPTPRYFVVHEANTLTASPLPFPLIVKPRHEGSSKSLSEKSRVQSLEALKSQADWLIRTYRQPALVEEFIAGTEFTVAVIGNDPPEALPAVQIEMDGSTELGDRFYTFSRISAPGLVYRCPSAIPPTLEAELRTLAVRAYQAIDCRDLGRVDFRVDRQGRPSVLEINPLPSLSTEDVFMTIATHLGVPYPAMVQRILNAAIARYRLEPCPIPSR